MFLLLLPAKIVNRCYNKDSLKEIVAFFSFAQKDRKTSFAVVITCRLIWGSYFAVNRQILWECEMVNSKIWESKKKTVKSCRMVESRIQSLKPEKWELWEIWVFRSWKIIAGFFLIWKCLNIQGICGREFIASFINCWQQKLWVLDFKWFKCCLTLTDNFIYWQGLKSTPLVSEIWYRY